MGSDWNFGGGSSSGGSDWSFGPTHHKKTTSSSGGGGFDFGPFGGIVHTAENAAGQAGDIISGIPNALVSTGSAAWQDFAHPNPHDKRLSDWSFLLEHPIAYGESYLHDPGTFGGKVIEPQIKATSTDVSALRRGDWHYFEKHPLNPVLDIAAVASLGGKAALVGARTGALGSRAAELANTERLLRVGDHAEALNQARTLQGRIRQRIFDQYSMDNPDKALIGANVRMKRILNKRAATLTVRAGVPVRRFQELTKSLNPAETFAFHVAAEGVPLDDRIAYYQAQLVERMAQLGGKKPKSVRPIVQYLQNLTAPAVRDALENPRPEFIDALNAGKDLEARAGQRLVETGRLEADTRVGRAGLPQREMLGEADVTTNLVNSAFPPPFRFWHTPSRGAGDAKFFKTLGVESMHGKVKPLGQEKHNAAILLQNALFQTDPERVLSVDYLSTLRHEQILKMQREALDPISRPLNGEFGLTGKRQDEWYYRPSYNRKTTAPIPREIKQGHLTKAEQLGTNTELARQSAHDASKEVVSQNLRDLGVDARDLHNIEKLNQLGIRRLPAAFGKDFANEYGGTSKAIRYFYDRPLDVWRAITLNYRPAWLVNNFVGNAIMGLATYGPAGAASYIRTLLATERGPDKVRSLWRWTVKQPTLRRKYGAVFQEIAPEIHSAGLYGTQTKITNPGVYEGKIGSLVSHPAVRKLGFAAKQVGKMVMSVGRGVTRAEILLAEDTGREAAFIREAGGDITKIRAAAQKMGEGHLSLIDALKRMDQPSIEQAVTRINDALGDFNDLSPFERRIIRRIIPFYSWFKVITKVSGKYIARYPARILLLKNIEDARSTKGEPPLPAWLTGSILVGKPHKGVQTLVSTPGLNPYETINQVATGGAGSVLSPFASAFIVGLTGRDPTFGGLQDYYGFGANTRGGWGGQLEMGGGALVSGLAPARLYTESSNYQGKLYAPQTYHAGPVSIDDFILQYLGLPIRHVKLQEAKRERGLK